MAPFRVECDIPMNVTQYFIERDTAAFRALTCKVLGMKGMRVTEAWADKEGHPCIKLVTIPNVDIPKTLVRFLGGEDFTFTDILTYPLPSHEEKSSYQLKFMTIPPIQPKKADISGTLTFVRIDDSHCKQVLDGHVDVRVFGLSTVIENIVTQSLKETYKQLPKVMELWLLIREQVLREHANGRAHNGPESINKSVEALNRILPPWSGHTVEDSARLANEFNRPEAVAAAEEVALSAKNYGKGKKKPESTVVTVSSPVAMTTDRPSPISEEQLITRPEDTHVEIAVTSTSTSTVPLDNPAIQLQPASMLPIVAAESPEAPARLEKKLTRQNTVYYDAVASNPHASMIGLMKMRTGTAMQSSIFFDALPIFGNSDNLQTLNYEDRQQSSDLSSFDPSSNPSSGTNTPTAGPRPTHRRRKSDWTRASLRWLEVFNKVHATVPRADMPWHNTQNKASKTQLAVARWNLKRKLWRAASSAGSSLRQGAKASINAVTPTKTKSPGCKCFGPSPTAEADHTRPGGVS
eukprot:jgi/Chlat1/6736/Chrsp50S06435